MSIKRVRIAPILILCLLVVFVWFTWQKSVLIQEHDRINIIIYGQETQFFSIGLKDDINYTALLAPDMKVRIPGGYGEYRVGAVGKLTALEKNPEIIKKTFSYATSSFVSLYFYPETTSVYYGEDNLTKNDIRLPTFGEIMSLKTNGSLFDKMYILYFFSKKGETFKRLTPLQAEDFLKRYKGYFYYEPYRSERKTVQVLYERQYKVAIGLSNILGGTGINVSDITKREDNIKQSCRVIEKNTPHSKTAVGIANFFQCDLGTGSTDIYDIIIQLNSLETIWEIDS